MIQGDWQMKETILICMGGPDFLAKDIEAWNLSLLTRRRVKLKFNFFNYTVKLLLMGEGFIFDF